MKTFFTLTALLLAVSTNTFIFRQSTTLSEPAAISPSDVQMRALAAQNDAQTAPASVDLGLSVRWAPYNIGASKPEESGNYYAFGESKPKSDYSLATHAIYTEDNIEASHNFQPLHWLQFLPKTDAATECWGKEWRLPTRKEFDELRAKCTWKWTSLNGILGYQVTGKNGNSIFLPAAGIYRGTTLCDAGRSGDYWSSKCDGEGLSARELCFGRRQVETNEMPIYYGLPIRPVHVANLH